MGDKVKKKENSNSNTDASKKKNTPDSESDTESDSSNDEDDNEDNKDNDSKNSEEEEDESDDNQNPVDNESDDELVDANEVEEKKKRGPSNFIAEKMDELRSIMTDLLEVPDVLADTFPPKYKILQLFLNEHQKGFKTVI